jgi:hypothetical protein
MILSDYLDSKLEKEVFDVIFIDSYGKLIEDHVNFNSEVIDIEYKKIAILKIKENSDNVV